ncbi:hypothetical protein SELMODRAFT_421716 [Selaginella moellendorffii]|uniref:Uncharacterized protein n=1 Tax=Selaginella moellendorffii TaxID=88036 RepID=D8SG54_SELML|nr:hypothetical protein SELMODRAFT_421716 [Selaginella moellendorffii]
MAPVEIDRDLAGESVVLVPGSGKLHAWVPHKQELRPVRIEEGFEIMATDSNLMYVENFDLKQGFVGSPLTGIWAPIPWHPGYDWYKNGTVRFWLSFYLIADAPEAGEFTLLVDKFMYTSKSKVWVQSCNVEREMDSFDRVERIEQGGWEAAYHVDNRVTTPLGDIYDYAEDKLYQHPSFTRPEGITHENFPWGFPNGICRCFKGFHNELMLLVVYSGDYVAPLVNDEVEIYWWDNQLMKWLPFCPKYCKSDCSNLDNYVGSIYPAHAKGSRYMAILMDQVILAFDQEFDVSNSGRNKPVDESLFYVAFWELFSERGEKPLNILEKLISHHEIPTLWLVGL